MYLSLAIQLLVSIAASSVLATSPAPSYFGNGDIDRNALIGSLQSLSVAPQHSERAQRQFQLDAATKYRRSLPLFERRSNPSNPPESGRSTSNVQDTFQTIDILQDAYNLPLSISSDPSQLVFVQLDTGSSDLWVVSSSCQSSECLPNSVLKYDETKSKTFTPLVFNSTAYDPIDHATTSPQPLGVNLSTNKTSSAQSANSHSFKRQTFSSTALNDTAASEVPFSLVYQDGTLASGYLATENFTLSGLQVPQQIFALVNNTNVTLLSQGISGVLGMGFPRSSVISRSLIHVRDQLGGARFGPLTGSILQQDHVSYPLFGLYLTRNGGRITFGAVDPMILPTRNHRSLVDWYDVVPFPSGNTALPSDNLANQDANYLDPYLSWALKLTGAGVAGRPIQLSPTYHAIGSSPLAVLDSGTPSIVGPASAVEAIFSQIQNSRHVGDGRFVVPCDTQERMYFSFGGRNITLPPDDYIIGPASGQPFLCFAWPAAIPPSSDGVDWILGTPFLRAVYSIYSIGINNRESPKIGLYPLRQPADSTVSSIIFAPEPTQNLSSFLENQATLIQSTLPNSPVVLTLPTALPYSFENATFTASIGQPPTMAGAPSTYQPILSQLNGDVKIPVLTSSSPPLAIPSNPAKSKQANRLIPSCFHALFIVVTMCIFSFSSLYITL